MKKIKNIENAPSERSQFGILEIEIKMQFILESRPAAGRAVLPGLLSLEFVT
jgi:hypothetical protein